MLVSERFMAETIRPLEASTPELIQYDPHHNLLVKAQHRARQDLNHAELDPPFWIGGTETVCDHI